MSPISKTTGPIFPEQKFSDSTKIADDNGREFALTLLFLIVANFCPK